MAFWRAVNVGRVCKHSPNPQSPLSWTPGGVLSFTQPAPSHTKLVSEGSHSCLKCSSVFAYFAHTILSFLTQSAICQYILFILSDWQYELGKGGWWGKKERGVVWLMVFFWLVPWLSVTLLLSLKLEFIFYKLEWNVFVFQVIISILLGCRLRLMKWAHQTVRCTNEAVRAGWLVPFAVRHLLKWQAGNKGPLATRESSVLLWSGQDNRAERWPGLLATCQLVSTTHRGNRAQRSMGGRRWGGQERGRRRERGGQWLTPACAWVLYSMLDIFSIHSGWKWKIGRDYTNVQVCTCRQADTRIDTKQRRYQFC